MAKVVTTLEICENAKLARDLALAGVIYLVISLNIVINNKYLYTEYFYW